MRPEKEVLLPRPGGQKLRKTLSEARRGADVTDAERRRMGELIEHGLRIGQSIHHVLAAIGGEFTCCVSTS